MGYILRRSLSRWGEYGRDVFGVAVVLSTAWLE
jgi:hypothetical protein